MEKKTFTQAEVNAIVQERLAREKRKEPEVIDVEIPEGEVDWKEKYAELDAQRIDLLKRTKLYDAGVEFDKIDEVLRLIKGETEEEVNANIELIMPGMNQQYLRDEFKTSKKKSYADLGKKSGKWNPFSS